MCSFVLCFNDGLLFILVTLPLLLLVTVAGSIQDEDISRAQADPIPIAGIEQKSIQLECSLPMSNPPRVRWLDFVYNSDPSPSQIFDSWNNTELHVTESHPNRMSYEVTLDVNCSNSCFYTGIWPVMQKLQPHDCEF
jgi:hypothetical protein